jgi:hypothetical protein
LPLFWVRTAFLLLLVVFGLRLLLGG